MNKSWEYGDKNEEAIGVWIIIQGNTNQISNLIQ